MLSNLMPSKAQPLLLAVLMACSLTRVWASADLEAVNFSSLNPNPMAPGGHPQSVRFTYANNGPGLYDAITYELYLSRNIIFGDSDDVKIGEFTDEFWDFLYPGIFDYSLSTPDPEGLSFFTIPSTALGSYYIIFRVIPAYNSSQTDPNLGNNFVCSTTSLLIGGTNACSYSIAPASGTFSASGGSASVSITASTNACGWAANSAGAAWVTVSPSNGFGSASATLTVGPNDTCLARSCNLTIAGETFTVFQAAGTGTFSINPRSWSPSFAARSTNVTVTASAGCNWSVLNPAPSWVRVAPSSGTGNRLVTVTVTNNPNPSPRACTLTIAGQSFSITQAAFSCTYSISPTSWSPSGNGGHTNVSLLTGADCSWSVLNPPAWVMVNPTNGVSAATVSISALRNATGSPRAATLTIAGQSFSISQPVQSPQPGPVLLLSPAEGAILSRHSLGFSWADVETNAPEAAWYHLQISSQYGNYVDPWVQNTTWQPTRSFAPGDYTWSVQPWNSAGLGPVSSTGHFSTPANPPSVPSLFAPNGQTISTPGITYSWTLDPFTTWYELSIYKNGRTFTDKWFPASAFAGTNCQQLIFGHSGGQYSWSVRGWNPDGMGAWSSIGAFSVTLSTPGAVTLYAPTGTVSAAGATEFSWSEEPAADWYWVWIERNSSKYLSQWVQGANSYIPSDTLPAGNYTWRVETWNAAGMGPWSATANFTVPAAGTPIWPVGSLPFSADPCYRWHIDDTTTWYELYINRNGALFFHQWFSKDALPLYADGVAQTCAVTGHSLGSYTWWVRGWSPSTGLGAWSGATSFSLVP